MPERTEQIELIINGMPITYTSKGRVVSFITSRGVVAEFKLPSDWAPTRVVQFMCSVIEANKVMI